jgi:AraC-like DNA-binding protein
MTPMDYIRQRRLLKAGGCCADPAAMGEIAAQVGYSSQSAFSAAMLRAFLYTFGVAARAWRQLTQSCDRHGLRLYTLADTTAAGKRSRKWERLPAKRPPLDQGPP